MMCLRLWYRIDYDLRNQGCQPNVPPRRKIHSKSPFIEKGFYKLSVNFDNDGPKI